MADFGLSKGLTFKIPASEYADREIEDMKYGEQLRRQQEAVDMAKAKLFADDFDMIVGSNPVDAEIIRKEGDEALRKLGELTNNNPNWHTDSRILMEMKKIKNGYKSSDAVLRSAVYKDSMNNFIKFKQEAAKNPTRYNLDELAAFENELKNYNGSNPLVFTPPRELQNLDGIETEIASKMDPDEYKAWNNGNIGAVKGKVSDARIFEKAYGIYKNNQNDYDYRYKGNTPEDIVNGIAKRLAAGTKTDVHFGTPDTFGRELALEKAKMNLKKGLEQQDKGGSLFDVTVYNTAKTDLPPEIMEGIFTTKPSSFYYDKSGKRVDASDKDFVFAGPIIDKGVKFDDKGNPIGGSISGKKEAPGYYVKDLQWAIDNGYAEKPFWSGEPKVAKGAEKYGSIDYETSPDGKERNYYFKLNGIAEIDATNPIYKNTMDKSMAPKLRAEAGIVPERESNDYIEVKTNTATGEQWARKGNKWVQIK